MRNSERKFEPAVLARTGTEGDSTMWDPEFTDAVGSSEGGGAAKREALDRGASKREATDRGSGSGPEAVGDETSPDERAEASVREGDPGAAVPVAVNQFLERLEMNSLEVKLYLDSIDQRISRMEPRLEGMRAGEDARLDAAARVPEAGVGESRVPEPVPEPVQELKVEPVDRPMVGSTTERRRRAQGVPVERRRAPHSVPVAETLGETWTWEPWATRVGRWKPWLVANRKWAPAALAVVLAVLVLGVTILGSGHHAAKKDASANVEDAGQVLADAVPQRRAKSSAEVPWSGSAGAGARTSTASGAGPGRAGRVPVEQGVLAPQASVAAGQPAIMPGQQQQAAEQPEAGTAAGASAASGSPAKPDAGLPASGAEADTSGTVSAATTAAAGTGTAGTSRANTGPSRGGSGPGVARRVNVSSGVMAGNLLYSQQPSYPKGFAGLFHTQGTVVMQAIISKGGKVQDLRVISGHFMLRGAAKDAVRTWRYRPYTINGSPVEVATIVSVEFRR